MTTPASTDVTRGVFKQQADYFYAVNGLCSEDVGDAGSILTLLRDV
jgi:hypothetical protein